MNILIVNGGIRKESLNAKVASNLPALAPSGMTLSFADIKNLPVFNADYEQDFPAAGTKLKEDIRKADGIIFISPEHNRSPAVALKNAIDWASRPYGDNAWEGKPLLVMGATGGSIGTSLAQEHLKSIALYLNMRVLGQPEVYIGGVSQKLGEDGTLTDEGTREHLTKALAAFADFVNANK